ncbi:MAG TPA: RelA/SpoT family protein [Ktedonobacteraceae bacterium]|nr:RelA/SpoT family protein [Ktedonobacteraceae bacterium]
MIDRSVEQHPVDQSYQVTIEQLLNLVRPYMVPSEIEKVQKAFLLAFESCRDVPGTATRPIPPLEHALAVTTILAQMMHVDAIGIAAALVFEAVDAELLLIEQVEHELGLPTARVVGSMARLNILERKKQNVATGAMLAIQNTQQAIAKKFYDEREGNGSAVSVENKKPRVREAMRRQQAETVRKMFVAMAEDPRVVLLKLAYRLHAMRLTCEPSSYPIDRQEMLTMAEETREIYAPLAGRLGMSRVESELEDLAFQVLEPDKFAWVRTIVEMERKQWSSYVERVCGILRSEMASVGVKAEVSGRVKHAYSFYRKLVRNAGDVEDFEHLKAAVDVNQIHDLIAFRILVSTTTDCYIALGHVHSLWKPKEGRIKDFIANPKPNGYSALHTTIFCLDDQLVEIQIRTHAMHEMAEYGVAMHWHYKDVGDHASASAKELLTWLHQLSEWQKDLRAANTSDADFVEAVKDDIFQEQIFVFTPKGEVKDLPVGSTPLDFAYRIHTMVGDRCAGARIITQTGSDEGERLLTRMVPLDYELKSGEIVDIVTSRSAHPTRDWLNFARTAAARSKIRRYLKTNERPINIQIGRERLDRELKSLSARSLDVVGEEAENWLCKELDIDTFDDILASVGADDLRPRIVVQKLLEYWQQREGKEVKEVEAPAPLNLPVVSPRQSATAQMEVAGVSGLLTRLANCCCPIPEDQIIGFISRGKGVVVHRIDCRNIQRLRERERLIPVSWGGMRQQVYHAPLVITARDRTGLLRDLATVVSDVGANLMSVNYHNSGSKETIMLGATIEIADLGQLQRLFTRLERVKGVLHVERDLGQAKS